MLCLHGSTDCAVFACCGVSYDGSTILAEQLPWMFVSMLVQDRHSFSSYNKINIHQHHP